MYSEKEEKINQYLIINSKYFSQEAIFDLKRYLLNIPSDKIELLESIKLVNPTIAFILSICLGSFGVDRMYVGDIGLGILKLITIGCWGVWTIVDLFLIGKRAKIVNYEKVMDFIKWACIK